MLCLYEHELESHIGLKESTVLTGPRLFPSVLFEYLSAGITHVYNQFVDFLMLFTICISTHILHGILDLSCESCLNYLDHSTDRKCSVFYVH